MGAQDGPALMFEAVQDNEVHVGVVRLVAVDGADGDGLGTGRGQVLGEVHRLDLRRLGPVVGQRDDERGSETPAHGSALIGPLFDRLAKGQAGGLAVRAGVQPIACPSHLALWGGGVAQGIPGGGFDAPGGSGGAVGLAGLRAGADGLEGGGEFETCHGSGSCFFSLRQDAHTPLAGVRRFRETAQRAFT